MKEEEDVTSGKPVTGSEPSDNVAETIGALVPLAKEFVTVQKETLALRGATIERQAEHASAQLAVDRDRWNKSYALLFAVVVAILAIAAALIFVKEELNSGMLLLSHVIALLMGFVGGAGWQRSRKQQQAVS